LNRNCGEGSVALLFSKKQKKTEKKQPKERSNNIACLTNFFSLSAWESWTLRRVALISTRSPSLRLRRLHFPFRLTWISLRGKWVTLSRWLLEKAVKNQ